VWRSDRLLSLVSGGKALILGNPGCGIGDGRKTARFTDKTAKAFDLHFVPVTVFDDCVCRVAHDVLPSLSRDSRGNHSTAHRASRKRLSSRVAQNVLFPSVAHDVWIGDFAICLIRDGAWNVCRRGRRGPCNSWPQNWGGGQLDVTPAADVYSLGKVIYYMLSGGTVLPRERLRDPEYAKIFLTGERQRLFESLLSRMIWDCPAFVDTLKL
jgi:hypothetical protein